MLSKFDGKSTLKRPILAYFQRDYGTVLPYFLKEKVYEPSGNGKKIKKKVTALITMINSKYI